MKSLRAIGRLLNRDQSGSAMTEFIIGLPIFILIFAGMGSLYRLNHEALMVKAETNAELWKNADANLMGMVPLVGAATSIGSFGDIYQNGLSGLGMYVDSWAKAGLAETIIPGQNIKSPANPVQKKIEGITNSDGTFANDLLNDMVNPSMDTSGFAGIVSSVIQTTGAGPALAAGIRYGAVSGEKTRSFSHPFAGQVTLEPGKLDLPAPNAAVHRLAAVAMTRMEMNTEQPYKDSALEFVIGPDLSGNPTAQEGTACSQQGAAYGNCVQSAQNSGMSDGDAVDACEDQQPPDSCGSLEGSGAPDFNVSWCKNGCSKP